MAAEVLTQEETMAEQIAIRVDEPSVESSASAVEWGAIFGGAIAAIGVTIPL